jgi:hypothetical protein
MNYLNKSFSVYMNSSSSHNECALCHKVDNYLYKIEDKSYCKSCYDSKQLKLRQKIKEFINHRLYELFLK